MATYICYREKAHCHDRHILYDYWHRLPFSESFAIVFKMDRMSSQQVIEQALEEIRSIEQDLQNVLDDLFEMNSSRTPFQCPICQVSMEAYDREQNFPFRLECGHVYHLGCIYHWVYGCHLNCLVCNSGIHRYTEDLIYLSMERVTTVSYREKYDTTPEFKHYDPNDSDWSGPYSDDDETSIQHDSYQGYYLPPRSLKPTNFLECKSWFSSNQSEENVHDDF